MKTLLLAALVALPCAALSGCAVVFQGPRGKACAPSWSHICHSLEDTDR